MEQSAAYCDVVDDFVFEPRAGWAVFQIEPAIGVQAMFLEKKYTAAIPDILVQSERTQNVSMRNKRNKGPFTYRLKKNGVDFAENCF